MLKIITANQKEEWNWYVSKSAEHDFYHTWSYHLLEKSGEPVLFLYTNEEDFIAFPLIKRQIDDTPWFDLSSVYGYAGPISSRKSTDLSDEFINNFNVAFLEYLRENQIVSVFSRLHPFFDQQGLIRHFSGITSNGKTVAIDLRQPYEEQIKNFDKNIRATVSKLTRKGYQVKEHTSQEEIRLFTTIYRETMMRVSASASYLFDEHYFTSLLQAPDFDCRLLLVYAEGEPVCGTIITLTGDIIQSHLTATKTSYLRESPAKFLFNYVTILGRQLGMKFFNLGGGVGFREDSLFAWKRAFSDYCLNYYTWRFIANRDVYYSLLENRGIDPDCQVDFFPLYRSKALPLEQ